MSNIVIRTSGRGWLPALATAYRNRTSVELYDDANIGVDPVNQTLFEMAQAGLSARELASVCIALGMSVAGIGMIVAAFFDPEPTSKLGLLIGGGGGTTCILGGGFTAIRILTKHRPPQREGWERRI